MLKQRAFTATLWSGVDIFLRQGLQFGVSVVLARLLTPEEFGTVALLYLFTGMASVFVDSGFSAALIRHQDIVQTDESTVFWFNLAMGTLVAVMLWVLAPVIATFYGLPILVPLMWIMAANVFFSALGSIHGTLLSKKLNFRVQMKIGVTASTLSGSLAIWMAWNGFGVWALATQTLVATCCTTTLLWLVNSWRPRWEFSFISAKRLFGFGGYLLGSSLLDVLYSRLYTVLIGKMFGVRELGYYSRADGTQQLPAGMLAGILSRVALPIFSAAADDPVKLRRGVQLSIRGMMLVNLPMMMGLAALAEPLVVALLGERWLPVAPILKVLCLAGAFWPLHVINLNVLMAQGYSNLFFRLEVAKKILGISLLLGGTFFGVMGIAWSAVLFGALAYVINAYYTQKFLEYGLWHQTADFAPTAVLSIVMFTIVSWLSNFWAPHPIVEVIVLSVIGAIIFIAMAFIFRVRSLYDAIDILRQRAVSEST